MEQAKKITGEVEIPQHIVKDIQEKVKNIPNFKKKIEASFKKTTTELLSIILAGAINPVGRTAQRLGRRERQEGAADPAERRRRHPGRGRGTALWLDDDLCPRPVGDVEHAQSSVEPAGERPDPSRIRRDGAGDRHL